MGGFADLPPPDQSGFQAGAGQGYPGAGQGSPGAGAGQGFPGAGQGMPGMPGAGQDYSSQGYGPRGPSDDHLWGLLSYLLTFVAGVLAPLVIYLIKKDESRYVRYHAAQSLNMAITATIYVIAGGIVSLIVAFATHGYALILIVPIYIAYLMAHLVYLILAAIGANRGEYYKVPIVISLPLVH